ncbi:hypothetical protein UF75_0577 [Desulfosporosinus sp. I2]|nr:hypothetical protein UF75_0577 [Desulfosporosinus sp. I2]
MYKGKNGITKLEPIIVMKHPDHSIYKLRFQRGMSISFHVAVCVGK